MKISEILSRKTAASQTSDALDFIAESQNLINQYNKDAVGIHSSEPLQEIQALSMPLEGKSSIEVKDKNNVKESISSVESKAEPSPKALKPSPLNDAQALTTTIGISEIEPLKASISNSNNSVAIAEQFRNSSVTESVTDSVAITEQLRNNSVIKAEQFRNKNDLNSNNSVTVAKQKRNNTVTKNVTDSVTITEQLRNDSVTTLNAPPHVNRLSGNKFLIVQTIFEFCQERGSSNTGPISRETFETRTGIDGEVIRVTCIRLIKEGYLYLIESKRGNGGYTIYELHPNTHSQLISGYFRNNSVTAPEQKRNNSVTESVTDSVTNASSKIDSKNINNLTNYLVKDAVAPTWFKELDFSKVQPIGPMMVNSSIRTLVQQKLNPEIVQDFINRFTSWMATQSKISNPVGIFCDKLKELSNEGDSPVLQAMTEEDRQVEAAFSAQVEKARVEMELIRKARFENAEKEADSAFENWYNSSDDSEKFKLAEPNSFASAESEAYKRILKAAYFEKVNPRK
ncbi:MAG: hypothetical protein ACXWRG_06635 [Bdellovibrio sp.]